MCGQLSAATKAHDLFAEVGVPVEHDRGWGNRIAAKRCDKQKLLSVDRCGVAVAYVADDVDASRKKRLRHAGLHIVAKTNVDRHESLIGAAVENFFPIATPRRVAAPGCRDLPLAGPLRKRSHVNLVAARFIG